MIGGSEELKRAEYALCGRILAGDWAEVVAAGVEESEELYYPAAREVYRVAKAHDGDAAATLCALAGQLLDGSQAEEVLDEMEKAGDTAAAIEGYARIVLKAWRTRGAYRAHAEIAKAIESGNAQSAEKWRVELLQYEAADRGEAGGFSLVSDAELSALDTPPPVPVVEGFLDVGEVALLTAPAKAGKSWLLLQMAKCVAAGIPFLGKVTRPGPVVYVNAEVGRDAWKRRSDAVNEALGIPPPPVFHASTRGQKNVTLATLPTVLKLALKAERVERVALIVVDPFYALVGAKMDEDKAADVKAVFFDFQRLAVELGAAVIVAHHTGKGDVGAKSANDRARGSSAFAGSPDAFFTLTPTGAVEERRWKLDGRRRNGIDPEPRTLQFDFPLFADVGAADGDTGGTSSKRYTLGDLTGAFAFEEEVLTVAEIVKRTGIGRSRAYELIREAGQQKCPPIVREGDGYRLNEGGGDDL